MGAVSIIAKSGIKVGTFLYKVNTYVVVVVLPISVGRTTTIEILKSLEGQPLKKWDCLSYRQLATMAYERAPFFFRLYCLSLPEDEDIPEVSESTMKQCLNQVCSKDDRGAKLKDEVLQVKLRTFWNERFTRTR